MESPFYRPAFFLTVFLCCCLPASGAAPVSPLNRSDAPGARASSDAPSLPPAGVTIPGPLRSFLRLAAVSQKASPDEVLPLVARNVVVEGYDRRGKFRKPTEYLVLLKRYVEQARELVTLAGPDGVIRVPSCSQAQPLLDALGYRLDPDCGPDATVETADPERAFLTVDSGFPLTDLDEALRANKPFAYAFPTVQVPMLFSPTDWTASDSAKRSRKGSDDVLDNILGDPALARLYWALARIDPETRAFLKRSPGLEKLVPLAPVLDFYGGHLSIRSGRVVVPGGISAEAAWKSLVGASPESPADFVVKLLTKDEGWLAAYFDALSRSSGPEQAYLMEPHRLRRFYEALRGQSPSPGPAKPVFRPDPGLVLLVSRLQLDPDGQPHVPGNLDVWKEILREKSDSKLVREWGRRAQGWKNPEQLLEGMFALSRVNSDDGPLPMYMELSELDRGRSAEQRLSPATVRLLAEKFSRFSSQYLIFSEFRTLDNSSITRFLEDAEAVDSISNRSLRADALGLFQANVGLWQILARQGQIPAADWNDSWQRVISPFATADAAAQLYDAARSSLAALWRAATGRSGLSEDEVIALLAGPVQTTPEGQQVRQEMANQIRSVMDAQRLVSLDSMLELGDGLKEAAHHKGNSANLIRLAGDLREFQMPKPLFTNGERIEWTPGPSGNPHIQQELATDLTKVIKSPRSLNELAEARGRIVPFLRDTLVGLNYAYYAPPGAQMLYNNPLFVRSHDFAGEMTITMGEEIDWKTPSVFGRGWTASGGAHLAGSLAQLPYVLAEAEQDFIVPKNVQSLIWEDLVPTLVTSAVVPRWWRVSRDELHAAALYQRFGEELLGASSENAQLRQEVMGILSDRMLPRASERVEAALSNGNKDEALSGLTPGEAFFLGVEFRSKYPGEIDKWGKAGQNLAELAKHNPEAVDRGRLSEDFGVPHPALAETNACNLLDVQPFPTFLGYSSRLLAESWDSNNLYWARLADEMGYAPVMLNRLVPELTHRMVENIFATDLEDWPALLRALHETGDEFRQGKLAALAPSGARAGL